MQETYSAWPKPSSRGGCRGETAAHGEFLILSGCEHAQGYGIARPMPAETACVGEQLGSGPGVDAWRNRGIGNGTVALMSAIVEHRNWVHALQRFLRGERRDAAASGRFLLRFCQGVCRDRNVWPAKDSAQKGHRIAA